MDSCGFRRLLFSVGLTSDRGFYAALGIIGMLNLGRLGYLHVFPPLMFIYATIKDLKYSLQRDEFPC